MSFGIYVGRSLSRTGHAWLAGYGDEPSSHWLEIVPAADHCQGATVKVGMTAEAILPGERIDLPQAPHTLHHIRVSYSYYLGSPSPLTNGGLNEAGVAVRDIWSPSRPALVALTPPIQRGPNYSDLARLVLERAKSAREGVEIIGQLIAAHGYSCYGGNSHLIADPEEAYVVIEFSGGRGLWVAERLGANSIRISRPGYIGVVPSSPNQDFLFPPHFFQTAEEQGWWRPGDGPFDVNRIYGDGKGPWEGARWIDAELRHRAVRPEKIGLEDLIFAIATPKLTGDTAGYGQVVPLVHPSDSALRHLWHAPIGAVTAPLVPIFLGQSEVPAEYGPHRYLTAGESARFLDQRHGPEQTSSVLQSAEARRSAVALFKRLMQLSFLAPEEELLSVHAHWRRMEGRLASELPDLLVDAAALISAGRREGALRLLTRFSSNALLLALSDAEALATSLEVRLRESGHLNRQEKPKGPQQLW